MLSLNFYPGFNRVKCRRTLWRWQHRASSPAFYFLYLGTEPCLSVYGRPGVIIIDHANSGWTTNKPIPSGRSVRSHVRTTSAGDHFICFARAATLAVFQLGRHQKADHNVIVSSGGRASLHGGNIIFWTDLAKVTDQTVRVAPRTGLALNIYTSCSREGGGGGVI